MRKGAEKRVESGHPWIFRSDVERVETAACAPAPGGIFDICSSRGRFLARGYMNPKSQIMLRIMTYEQEPVNRDFIYKRIKDAWEYRLKVADTGSCRVVFAESDFLPALIVDKFNDILVVQTLALGIDNFKNDIVEILSEVIGPAGVYERNDAPVRELEGLDMRKGFLKGIFDTKIIIKENGISFTVDVENGQKTGYFLDQKENRAAIRPYVAQARVLDCFCHTGSFSLHAACFGASDVLGVDISEQAVELAAENARLNGLEGKCRFLAANTFDYLRETDAGGEKYDAVILDPPAFAKSRSSVEGAVRGYKEINLRAMKVLKRGGFLITCSCSHHISPELFTGIIREAAADAKRKARLVEFRSQSKDHPVLLASDETRYLKCAILQIV